MTIENYHTIKPLWVEIWSLHAVLLMWSSIELSWGSFSLWYLQRMFGAKVANALLEEKGYTGPSIFGEGCPSSLDREVNTFDMNALVDSLVVAVEPLL